MAKLTTYNIWRQNKGKDEINTIHGYTFDYSGIRYGISRNYLVKDGKKWKEEIGYEWKITELTTGALVGIAGRTKKEAIEKLVSRENERRREAIREAVKAWEKENRPDHNENTIIQEQILSVHTNVA